MNIKKLINTILSKDKNMGKRMIPLMILAVVSSVWISVSAASVNTVALCVYGETKEVVTSGTDLESILQKENINISKNDKVEFSPVKNGKGSINIIKRYEVLVKFGDVTSNFLVEAATVKEAIEFSKIKYNPEKYILNHELTSEIKEDITIEITLKPEPAPEPTPEKTQEEQNTKQEVKTVKQTENVKKTQNAEKVQKTKKSSSVSYSADKENFTVAIGNEQVKVKKMYVMKGTAYTYGDDGGNVTATGVSTKRGIVAVDPKVIPLGSRLYIRTPSGDYIYGYAVAADTGGAIKGKKIDIFVETEKEAYNFGRRNLEVYVLE